ncbi:MAG: hypothetical protein IT580_13960 [Verrucomicrobiales bacterium]|jgi:flagellar motility protein MotE (MotC chaperone)|nr:hypothetical protein [Verrucomicrobiales bacterium]
MVRKLQSPLVAVLLGLLLYAGVTAALWPAIEVPKPNKPANPKAIAIKPPPPKKGPSWDYVNPEVDQLVDELKKERQALADRARQLDELAARLQSERTELNVVTQQVAQLQKEFDNTIIRVTEEETTNLKRLAKVYTSMSPEGAAVILKQLEETTIVKILTFMKDGETAPILETIAKLGDEEAKMAASISERLRLAIVPKPAAKPKT